MSADLEVIQTLAERVKENINRVIVGKEETVDQLLVAIITSGHVLLEDVPGTGKTLMAKSLSKSLDSSFKRIQFTPDLLPTDVSGINFYNQKKAEFEFRPGPIFANIVLADEINRATPRTQSVLLECMEERQVTIDGDTRSLNRPFLVIATQNPVESQGTFPLPEAQLDRFLLKLSVGYPSKEEGLEILKRFKQKSPLEELSAVATNEEIINAQNSYSYVHVSEELLNYMMDIIHETRNHPDVELGVSPRGSQALLKAVQAYAIIQGRSYVIPDDIKAMANPVLAHRLVLNHTSRFQENQNEKIIESVLNNVTVPSEEEVLKGIDK
ncbi:MULTISPECIES: AAA family ATPase [Bacillaceae]|uniref:MoxR family ATPase n=1 Tax=Evansella alkalicola TaxID=745819 RepID=A0ABS6JUG4_9BACI|nr:MULTISPECIES: MoxR family ATPase [Bacillaceae]MBU9722050.1 MoxR family ATPase [Bacillus alkalicola]